MCSYVFQLSHNTQGANYYYYFELDLFRAYLSEVYLRCSYQAMNAYIAGHF